MCSKSIPYIIDNKKYIVIECEFKHQWDVIRESRTGVTYEQALEISTYWLTYKKISQEQIRIIEVENIIGEK